MAPQSLADGLPPPHDSPTMRICRCNRTETRGSARVRLASSSGRERASSAHIEADSTPKVKASGLDVASRGERAKKSASPRLTDPQSGIITTTMRWSWLLIRRGSAGSRPRELPTDSGPINRGWRGAWAETGEQCARRRNHHHHRKGEGEAGEELARGRAARRRVLGGEARHRDPEPAQHAAEKEGAHEAVEAAPNAILGLLRPHQSRLRRLAARGALRVLRLSDRSRRGDRALDSVPFRGCGSPLPGAVGPPHQAADCRRGEAEAGRGGAERGEVELSRLAKRH
mmetsp:Transcript_21845/g.70399  ORF Transcript_21845/g.70399 Transcript_21845/m.70399 type:complete len:285 (+) Transcript_21845:262-1116(+)